VHVADKLVQLQGATGQLEGTLGRSPTRAELAAELDLSQDQVTFALRYQAGPLSLSEPLPGDGELADLVEDHSALSPAKEAEAALLVRETEELLAALDERARSFGCGSGSTAASRARSGTWLSTSTSVASASERSRPRPCPPCGNGPSTVG